MKVVYELITENDSRYDQNITEEEMKELMDWAGKTMNDTLNSYLNTISSDNAKVIVKCKSISEFKSIEPLE